MNIEVNLQRPQRITVVVRPLFEFLRSPNCTCELMTELSCPAMYDSASWPEPYPSDDLDLKV